jgi:SpoVK/Ycf46/Vps4 family AAA+-type ATPase
VHSHLERYAKRSVPRTPLAELVLADDLKEQIEELIRAVRFRPELRRALDGRSIGPNGIAALFNGPPGTGKTMTASAMATELGLPMYKIDVSSIVDRFVGETEKNLSRIFEEAESERGLLLFDEADSLFTRRVEVSDSHDRYANMQVNMLLNLIDEYTGLVILTTNLKASIDTAFLRRMSFKLTFELPEPDQRAALWRVHLPPEVPLARNVDLVELADRYRASGGEIRNAVYRALLMITPGSALDSETLSRAVARELEASGNVVRR